MSTAQFETHMGAADAVAENVLDEFRSAMHEPVLTQYSDNYDEIRAL